MNLVLGTANFMNSYGKKLYKNDCYKILDAAKSLGIYALDTAPAYGESEQVIQEWLDRGNKMKIFTKGTNARGPRIKGDDVETLLHDEEEVKTGFPEELYTGVSLYDPALIPNIPDHYWIQAPFNPLNHAFKELAPYHRFIARSIFVGGKVYGQTHRETVAKLTFGFLRSHKVQNCVFGVESVDELEMNVRVARDCKILDTRHLS